MIIGKKTHNRHEWCAGIEFGLTAPDRRDTIPRLEIWCYKIIKYPPRGEAFNKKRDIKGFWRIFWWEPEITATTRRVVERKGWRPIEVTYPIKIRGKIRTW